jgi:carbonic anhydrase
LTRGVEWWVFKDPLTVSKQQLQTLHEQFLSDNARQQQAISDRPVILFTDPQK